jgi:hypothetical protein
MSEPPRRQFGLRALLGLTAVCAGIFGAFHWLGFSRRTSLFVAAILVVALIAAIILIVTIGRSAMRQESDGNTHGNDRTPRSK